MLVEEQTQSAEMSLTETSPPAHLVSATKVDEEDDIETTAEYDESFRETIRQDVLRQVAHTEAEAVDDDTKGNHNRNTMAWIAL